MEVQGGSGQLWQHGQTEEVLRNLDKQEIRRQESIYELICSEEAYMADLDKIIRYYKKPLVQGQIITAQESEELFGSIDQLLELNQELLKALKQRQAEQTPLVEDVSDVLGQFFDAMGSVYGAHCVKVKSGIGKVVHLKATNKLFAAHLNNARETNVVCPLGLDSYLLKPLQRVTKYPLLVAGILQYTPPSHKSHASIQSAYEHALTCLQCINEETRHLQDTSILEDITNILNFVLFVEEPELVVPGRRFVHHGDMTVETTSAWSKGKRTTERLHCFLFNDMLLLAKKPRRRSFRERSAALSPNSNVKKCSKTSETMTPEQMLMERYLVLHLIQLDTGHITRTGEQQQTVHLTTTKDVSVFIALSDTTNPTWVAILAHAVRDSLDIPEAGSEFRTLEHGKGKAGARSSMPEASAISEAFSSPEPTRADDSSDSQARHRPTKEVKQRFSSQQTGIFGRLNAVFSPAVLRRSMNRSRARTGVERERMEMPVSTQAP